MHPYAGEVMETKFSFHAVERMFQREISAQEVEGLLAKPDGVIRQSRDKMIAYKRIDGRTDNSVAVVAVEGKGAWEVITVMVNFEVRE